jgi:hypothetical protein
MIKPLDKRWGVLPQRTSPVRRRTTSAFGKPNSATTACRRASSASDNSVRSLGLRRGPVALERTLGSPLREIRTMGSE